MILYRIVKMINGEKWYWSGYESQYTNFVADEASSYFSSDYNKLKSKVKKVNKIYNTFIERMKVNYPHAHLDWTNALKDSCIETVELTVLGAEEVTLC